jgi:tape measure domain-containing protein
MALGSDLLLKLIISAQDMTGNAVRSAREGIQSISTTAQKVYESVKTYLTYKISLEGGKELLDLGDEYENLKARVKLASDTQQEFNAGQKELFRIAQETRSGLESVVTLYTKTEQSVRDLGGSQQDALDLTKTISEAFKVSGASASEAEAGIQQLAQGLQSGVLRGDEFNSVMESAPRLAQAMADGLGVPRSALRSMAEAGELTAERITRALLSQKEVIGKEYAQLPNTVDGALTQAKNSLLQYVGELNASYGITQQVAGGIQFLAGHLDELARIAGIVATVYGASLVKSVAQATAAKIADIQATRAQAATAAAAAAEVAAATQAELQQHVANAQAQVAEMRARIANTESLIAHIRAQGGNIASSEALIRLQQQLLTQQNALTAATARQAEAEAALQASMTRTAEAITLGQRAMTALNWTFNGLTALFIGWEIGQLLNKLEQVRFAGTFLGETIAKLGVVWKVFTGELTADQGKKELENIPLLFDDIRKTVTDAYQKGQEESKRLADSQKEVSSSLAGSAKNADSFADALNKTAGAADGGAKKLGDLIQQYDLLKPENADKLELAMRKLGGTSEAAAKEVREQLVKAVQEMGGPELQAKIESLQAKMQGMGPVSREVATELDVTVREQFRRLGIDADQALTGISQKVSDSISALNGLAKSGQLSGAMLKTALSDIINQAKTTAEFDAVRDAIDRLGKSGALSLDELVQAYGQVREAQSKVGVSAAEVRQAQDEARIAADQLAKAISNGTATQDMFADAAAKSARALDLQSVQAKTTTQDINTYGGAVRNAASEMAEMGRQAAASMASEVKSLGGAFAYAGNAASESAQRLYDPLEVGIAQVRTLSGYIADQVQWTYKGMGSWDEYFATIKLGMSEFDRLQKAKASVDELTQSIRNATATGKNLAWAAEQTTAGFGELDRQHLEGLQAAIDAAKQKLQAFRDSVKATQDQLKGELVQQTGSEQDKLQYEYQQKKLELQERINEASKLGDSESVAALRDSLRLLDEIQAAKERSLKLAEEENTAAQKGNDLLSARAEAEKTYADESAKAAKQSAEARLKAEKAYADATSAATQAAATSRINAEMTYSDAATKAALEAADARIQAERDYAEAAEQAAMDAANARTQAEKDYAEASKQAALDAADARTQAEKEYAEAVQATVEKAASARTEAEKAYADSVAAAIAKAGEEADRVVDKFAESMRQIRADAESFGRDIDDAIRGIQREGLDPEARRADQILELREKTAQAERALAAGDVDEAQRLRDQIVRIAEGLSSAVADAQGQVILTQKQAAQEAIQFLADAKALNNQITQAREQQAQAARAAALRQVETLKQAELQRLADVRAQTLADIEEEHRQELAALAERKAQALADIEEEHRQELAALAERKAQALANIEEEHRKSLEALAKRKAQALADIEATQQAELDKAEKIKNQALADIKETLQKELQKQEDIKAKELARIAETHQDAKAKAKEVLDQKLADIKEEEKQALDSNQKVHDAKMAQIKTERQARQEADNSPEGPAPLEPKGKTPLIISGARAGGGRVDKGKVYLGGEEGPEPLVGDDGRLYLIGEDGPGLFESPTDGTVLPADHSPASMRSTSTSKVKWPHPPPPKPTRPDADVWPIHPAQAHASTGVSTGVSGGGNGSGAGVSASVAQAIPMAGGGETPPPYSPPIKTIRLELALPGGKTIPATVDSRFERDLLDLQRAQRSTT